MASSKKKFSNPDVLRLSLLANILLLPFLILFLIYYSNPFFDYLVIDNRIPRLCSSIENDRGGFEFCSKLLRDWNNIDEDSLKTAIVGEVNKTLRNDLQEEKLNLEFVKAKTKEGKKYAHVNVTEDGYNGGFAVYAIYSFDPKTEADVWDIIYLGQNLPTCDLVENFPKEVVETCYKNGIEETR